MKNAVLGFHPIDNVDELLTDEVAETHDASLSVYSCSATDLQPRQMLMCSLKQVNGSSPCLDQRRVNAPLYRKARSYSETASGQLLGGDFEWGGKTKLVYMIYTS